MTATRARRHPFSTRSFSPAIVGIVLLLVSSISMAQDPHRDDWYLAQPPDMATIQLSGHATESDALAYIRKHQLDGETGYFTTTFHDAPWYAVTYGRYASLEAAREALDGLPAKLRTNAPWPRSFAAIKPLIARAGGVTTEPAKADTQSGTPAEAKAAYDSGDYPRAAAIWRTAAEQGNAEAQFNLAVLYSRGEGVEMDGREAIAWYTRAAEQGHAPAQFNLGAAYLDGRLVPSDERQAAAWWLQAAEQDFVQAQFNIGSLYCRGIGVERDIENCKYWYGRAAANGDSHAQEMLQRMNAESAPTRRPASLETPPEMQLADTVEPRVDPVDTLTASEPLATEPTATEPSPAAATDADTVKGPVTEYSGNAWYLSRNPEHLTIQLYSSWERQAVDGFIRKHALDDRTRILTTSRVGRDWYSVTYGEYATLDAARDADERLVERLKLDNTWVRPFHSIQQSLALADPEAPGEGGPADDAETGAPITVARPAGVRQPVISSEDQQALRKAQSAFVHGKYNESHEQWLPLAQKGIAEAQYSLGFLYHSGWGPERDLARAIHWYSLAAEQEESRAQFNLGVLLLEGEDDVAQDRDQGMRWLQRSAANDNTRARELLVEIYTDGLYGLEASATEAQRWKGP